MKSKFFLLLIFVGCAHNPSFDHIPDDVFSNENYEDEWNELWCHEGVYAPSDAKCQ